MVLVSVDIYYLPLLTYSQEDLSLYRVDIDGPINMEDDSEVVAAPDTVNLLQPHYSGTPIMRTPFGTGKVS